MSKCVGKRQVCDFFLGGFATYGALWVLVEPIAFLFSLKPQEGFVWYCAFGFLAVAGGVYLARPVKQIRFQIPVSDSTFEIRFGNVLGGEGVVVIPVNEYFDGQLGAHVSEKSLHGQFIRNVLGGQTQTFLDLTRTALTGIAPAQKGVDRPSGQCDRYPIGTIAPIDVNDQRYLLAALSHTDLSSLKASATVHDLWIALTGVWEGIHRYSNGQPVRIPLIGSGLSGVGLPPGMLIDIMVISFVYYTKQQKAADVVTLVLPHRLAGTLDLNSIKRNWS